MLKNNRGLTLVEVLLGVTISAIIIVIIWNVFFYGMNSSKIESDKTAMQQELNRIVLMLQRIHHDTTIKQYTLAQPSENRFEIEAGGIKTTFEHPNFHYTVSVNGTPITTNALLQTASAYDVQIIISHKDNSRHNVEMKTRLMRIQ